MPRFRIVDVIFVSLMFCVIFVSLMFLNSNQYEKFLTSTSREDSVATVEKEDSREKAAFAFVPTSSNGNPAPYWPVMNIVHYQNLSRTFSPWPNNTWSWCSKPGDYDRKTPAGLLFVKLQKAASSTMAGIALRIAHRVGRIKNGPDSPCASMVKHVKSNLYHGRDRTRSFMFSSVRDPTQRLLSYIFYTASYHNLSTTDDDKIIDMLKHRSSPGRFREKVKWDSGYQVGYLHTGPPPDHVLWNSEVPDHVTDLSIIQSRIKDILEHYDFLIVVERLDESLVALQLLLNLDPTDLLYVSGSKESGGWTKMKGKCHKLIPKFVSPLVRAFLESPEWLARNYGDFLLYHAANQSLDATIEHLGRHRFDEALKAYRLLLAQAQTTCQSKVMFPCSPEGKRQFKEGAQNCYNKDWGCGYPCLDQHFPSEQRALMH
jgi:Galactose-3-O-sulfotransferase